MVNLTIPLHGSRIMRIRGDTHAYKLTASDTDEVGQYTSDIAVCLTLADALFTAAEYVAMLDRDQEYSL